MPIKVGHLQLLADGLGFDDALVLDTIGRTQLLDTWQLPPQLCEAASSSGAAACSGTAAASDTVASSGDATAGGAAAPRESPRYARRH